LQRRAGFIYSPFFSIKILNPLLLLKHKIYMLYSMTGFGRAEQSVGDKVFLVEVKSLNGKQFDIRLNIPSLLKPFEFDIRNMLQEKLLRGSVECNISIKQNGSSKPVTINTDLAKAYYNSIAELSKELNLDSGSILSALLKLPEVITNSSEMLTPEEWNDFQQVLSNAIDQLKQHRMDEGKATERDLLLRIENILLQQQIIAKLEPGRQQKVRDGLRKVLEDNVLH
jgi:uncharacterized protein (TIGR00255 family)